MLRRGNALCAMGATPAALAFARSVKLPGFVEKNRVIWKNGGSRERFFHVLGWFTVVFLLSATGIVSWLVWNRVLPYGAFFSFTLVASTYGAVQNVVCMVVLISRGCKYCRYEGSF